VRLSEAVVCEAFHMGGRKLMYDGGATAQVRLKVIVSPNLTPIGEYVTLLKLHMKFQEL
jgi:hypothetical protein